MKHFRQGDVLLIEVPTIPKSASVEAGERCTLAKGEATGHTHDIASGAKIWVDLNDGGRRYLEIIEKRVALQHEEHGEIEIKGPALYEIIIQSEYALEVIRRVSD